ncbi:putative hydrolase [Ruminococcaceae bacterium FB2012]|nr:putative hydrolase [Ruminococcaceae bacterium FB2012]
MIKIQADMHTHTVASTHAYSTVMENCKCAEALGLKAIGMTDHAMGMPDAPHGWHFENLKSLPRKISGVYVIRGIEADIIDREGELDVSDGMLSKLEWVVASMHSWTFSPGSEHKHTEAYSKVCENKWVDVIGHPTTKKFPCDMEACVKTFKEYGKLVEINESSLLSRKSSEENAAELLRLCKKYEVPVILNTDAHFCELVGKIDVASRLIEETGFPESLIFNSEWERVREHIIKKHGDIGI